MYSNITQTALIWGPNETLLLPLCWGINLFLSCLWPSEEFWCCLLFLSSPVTVCLNRRSARASSKQRLALSPPGGERRPWWFNLKKYIYMACACVCLCVTLCMNHKHSFPSYSPPPPHTHPLSLFYFHASSTFPFASASFHCSDFDSQPRCSQLCLFYFFCSVFCCCLMEKLKNSGSALLRITDCVRFVCALLSRSCNSG